MIHITWRYAQRPVMLRFPYINKFSIISYISRTRRLPHRYSTLYAPMTDSVDACNPHPTTSLASDDSISSSSRYNTHCANINTGLDPRKYTSGRWLRRDELERDSRILNVDFDALRHRVMALPPLQETRKRKGDTIEFSSSPAIMQGVLLRGYPLPWQDQLG